MEHLYLNPVFWGLVAVLTVSFILFISHRGIMTWIIFILAFSAVMNYYVAKHGIVEQEEAENWARQNDYSLSIDEASRAFELERQQKNIQNIIWSIRKRSSEEIRYYETKLDKITKEKRAILEKAKTLEE